MNYLFHMILSGGDEELLVGNFMGDFVKGPLVEGRFPGRVGNGVALHRRIDSFAERHPLFRRSRERLDPSYGRYRGIMVDMFYDHLLTTSWHDWSAEPLHRFLARSRTIIQRHRTVIPADMLPLLPVIFDDLLPSYGTVEGIGAALARFSRRIGRPNPLAGGERELLRLHREFRTDFIPFTTDLFRHTESIMISDSRRTDHEATP